MSTVFIKRLIVRVGLLCVAAILTVAASGCGYVVAAGAGGAAGYAVGRGQDK